MTEDVNERANTYRMGLSREGQHSDSFKGNIDETIAWLQEKKDQIAEGSSISLATGYIRWVTPKRTTTTKELEWAERAYESREGEQWKPYDFLGD